MKRNWYSHSLAAIFLIFTVFAVVSCEKENSQSATDEQELEASNVSTEAEGEAELAYNDVFDDVMGVNEEVALGGTGVFGRVNTCPTVTITRPTANPFPVRVQLDYGNGCVGRDGRFRKGKVIVEYTSRLIVPGAIATTTFDGYFIDSVKVEGTHKITNTSVPTNTPPTRSYRVEVINGKLTRPNGNFVEWNSTRNITQVEGLATAIALDDIFRIEGNSRGRVKRGNLITVWESNITEPLIKRFTCRWIVKGKIRVVRLNPTVNNAWVAVLDFGNGLCDNLAWITINNRPPRQITLP